MRLRFHALATLPLLCSFAALASAQDAPPPVKMGLWQTESTTSVEGAAAQTPMGQAVSRGGRTEVRQGCLTPDTWKSDFAHMEKRQPDAECQQSNFQQDDHHVSFDEKCGGQGSYSSNVHFEMLVDDTENAHGHADVQVSSPAFPQPMTVHMTMKAKYLSSSCGNIKPGESREVR